MAKFFALCLEPCATSLSMRNIKLTIAYDGSRYAGWQTQTSRQFTVRSPRRKSQTLQEILEKALQKILREKVHLTGSGRTDAGVHAVSQIAAFKTRHGMDVRRLRHALNGVLPRDIAVLAAEQAPASFHARFSAVSKIYRYVIYNEETRWPFVRSHALWVRQALDLAAMRRESGCLLGTHDFKSFQASDRRPRQSRCRVKKIDIRRCRGQDALPFLKNRCFVVIDIEADGFLRHMVRNIVGTLLDIGRGRIKKGELERILKAKDRRRAGPCAPPQGLYLSDVRYG